MPTPAELLSVIQTTLAKVQASDADFSPQQQPFVQHLARTTNELRAHIDPMPQTDMALRRLIPRVGDELTQRIAALFGYAKLLLDSPQSFDNATLTTQQASHLQTIYQHSKHLYDLVEAIQQAAHAERVANHKAPAEAISIGDFLKAQKPILTYLLRDKPIEISMRPDDALVEASPYHLAALLDHIVVTLADDMALQGALRINGRLSPDESVYTITLFCERLVADSDTWDTLFVKNGRHIYMRRLQEYGGHLKMSISAEDGVIFFLKLPRVPNT